MSKSKKKSSEEKDGKEQRAVLIIYTFEGNRIPYLRYDAAYHNGPFFIVECNGCRQLYPVQNIRFVFMEGTGSAAVKDFTNEIEIRAGN